MTVRGGGEKREKRGEKTLERRVVLGMACLNREPGFLSEPSKI